MIVQQVRLMDEETFMVSSRAGNRRSRDNFAEDRIITIQHLALRVSEVNCPKNWATAKCAPVGCHTYSQVTTRRLLP